MERESPRFDHVQRFGVVLAVPAALSGGVHHSTGFRVTRAIPNTAARCPKKEPPVAATRARSLSVDANTAKNATPAAITAPPRAPRSCCSRSSITSRSLRAYTLDGDVPPLDVVVADTALLVVEEPAGPLVLSLPRHREV